ncbi:LxmA leader domain family RiPP [Bacillus atrophaeus]
MQIFSINCILNLSFFQIIYEVIIIMKNLISGYTAYTSPVEVQKSANEENQLGNVGTSLSLSLSVSYSASVSWSWSVSF